MPLSPILASMVKLQEKSPAVQCLIMDDKVDPKLASMVASMWARGIWRRLFQPHFLSDHSPMPIPARAVLALFALLAPLAAALIPATAARAPEVLTPLLFAVENPPVPFPGSDGQTHLVYELF